MNTPTKKSLAYATRDEVEVQLNLLDGKLPDDLYGYVFFNSPCGTVNSGGLPYKEKLADGKSNPEFGSSVFNGDAMMLRFDLSQKGLIRYKSKMLKTPCWYADDATKMGNTEYPSNIGFKMRNY
jgi:carotenoid cleavage dioxygenase-like enzyme